ncbi:hypothetical protein [Ruminococcus sp.]|uniref:hypothetical protein n=1 Tax=Ruminococcus sp. TaxID=41978 RepID=UPI004024BACD
MKLYRWVMLSMAVCIAVLAIAAGYTVGVVSQNNVIAQIDVNIGSIETYLEKNHNATQLLTDEFKEDYSAKTRTIAMLLAQDSSFITDDRTLEELRVTVNADMISVADADGNVVASTDPSGAGTSIREEFRSHLEEDVYTDALFLLDSDTPTIVAASSLDGGHGMVQITFSADSVVSLLQDADLANIASSMPLYSSGTTAILEADTMKYISCTDTDLIGQTADFDKSSMKRNKGKISVADADGNVVASTDPSGAGTSIREEFRSHLEEDVYTDALFLLDSDTPTIVAASSLDGGHGMVQITFSADSVVSLLQDADLANIASSMPLYSSGTTAILEADTMKYISCTDTDLIGQTADFDKSSMKRNKGKFDVKDADGKTNMVHYQSSGDYIIMATVPYAEVYRVRNIVVGWVIGGGIGILAVTCLALRMELLRQDAKNAKK